MVRCYDENALVGKVLPCRFKGFAAAYSLQLLKSPSFFARTPFVVDIAPVATPYFNNVLPFDFAAHRNRT